MLRSPFRHRQVLRTSSQCSDYSDAAARQLTPFHQVQRRAEELQIARAEEMRRKAEVWATKEHEELKAAKVSPHSIIDQRVRTGPLPLYGTFIRPYCQQ